MSKPVNPGKSFLLTGMLVWIIYRQNCEDGPFLQFERAHLFILLVLVQTQAKLSISKLLHIASEVRQIFPGLLLYGCPYRRTLLCASRRGRGASGCAVLQRSLRKRIETPGCKGKLILTLRVLWTNRGLQSCQYSTFATTRFSAK